MGLLDLPAPLFTAVDGVLGVALPPVLRVVLWGVLAGWLTMVVYRRLSNQEKIGLLKEEQKVQQKLITDFDGEFGELMPLIRKTLGTGLRQLGLALGPALLATIPILFLVVWVAGNFGYRLPEAGEPVRFTAEPPGAELDWQPADAADKADESWIVSWPGSGQSVRLAGPDTELLELPLSQPVPVIHKKRWWNLLMANPIGYLPERAAVDVVHIGLPEQNLIPIGPDWAKGWMFSFFLVFLLSSFAFKILLRID